MTQPVLSLKGLCWKLCTRRADLEQLAADAVHHYHPFVRVTRKKSRRIDNPDERLKRVQRRIDRTLLKKMALPGHLHGGVIGRSALTNASEHLGTHMVVRLDLRDFFPSVTDRQVYAVWVKTLGYSPKVAALLTSLTSYHGRLPQGAPSSSSLANLVLSDADSEIRTAALSAGCTYTRYVDDLIFSGAGSQNLVASVAAALQKAGFRVSRAKIALMRGSELQEVTGLSVNSRRGPSVPRYKRSRVRAAIRSLSDPCAGQHFATALRSITGRVQQVSITNSGAAQALRRQLAAVLERGR